MTAFDEESATANTPLVKHTNGHENYKAEIASSESIDPSPAGNAAGSSLRGRLILLLVALLYGSLNVSLRFVYELPGPPSASALSTARGWLAVLCFVPFLTSSKASMQALATNQGSIWKIAVQLALFNFGSQGFLNLGLIRTESARAAFLTQTSVVMTPILSYMAGQRLGFRVWIGCLLALAGLLLLSDTGGAMFQFGVGDFLCLTGAFCWSCYIFRVSSVGDSFDEVALQGAKTLILAMFYSTWFAISFVRNGGGLWLGWVSLAAWGLLFYSALGPGAVADILQQKGQGFVSAAEANVILSMEPVFTAILGFCLLGEATSWQENIGGGMIVIASIISTD